MTTEAAALHIPVYRPRLTGREREYVNQCLDSSWISSRGEFIGRFEREFSSYIGVQHATTVANGTVALHLALMVLGVGPGDEVIVPTLTYIASVNAIASAGATPVFVDSRPDTWNVDPEQVLQKLTSKTRAIMAIHLYGLPCDMTLLRNICREHDLFLIEDAAEAFGSQYQGQYVGGFGDIATFSFFGNKTITTGEGGMVVSNNQAMIDRAAYLKSQAVSLSRAYWHDEIGFNYRMTNVCAAIGVAQLEDADRVIREKRMLAQWYQAGLSDCPLTFQAEPVGSVSTYWMVSVLAENQMVRDGLRDHLLRAGIETRPLFYPAHMMPVFRRVEEFPIAESLSARGINLPSFPDLTRSDVDIICSTIRHFYGR